MNIVNIEQFNKQKIKLSFDDESFIVIYKNMLYISEEALPAELPDNEYEELFKGMLTYAKRRAMGLLSKKDYTREALTLKLIEDGYNPGIIESTMAYLDGFHYLDDERVAANIVRSHRESKSRAVIRQKLLAAKVPEELIESAIDNNYHEPSKDVFAPDEEDPEWESAVIVKHLVKMHVTGELLDEMSYEDKQKLMAKLYRKGFDPGKVRKALDELTE